MPNVPVDDILIHPRDNDLIAGTHGRSLWVLDNISSLEALTPETLTSDAFLVPPAHARLLAIYTPQAWFGAGQHFAPNPDFGAAVEYYLRSGSKDDVRVRVADARGVLVRTLKGAARPGLNRVSWDLRLEPPISDNAREAMNLNVGATPQAPLVLPGIYSVAIETAGHQLKGELKVDGDPRVVFSDADRRSRQDLLLKLYELQKSLVTARAAAAAGVTHFDAVARTSRATGHETQERLRALQAEITGEMNTVNALSRSIEGFSGVATADQRRQITWVFDDAARSVDGLNEALQTNGERPAQLMSIPKRR
jgi:hypothetical protein